MERITLFLVLTALLAMTPFRAMASGETTSPNMGLTIPGVGVTSGPDWASDINVSLGLIDGHDHSPGKGVQVTPAGININADLACNSQNLLQPRSVRLQPYANSGSFNPTALDVGAIYEITPDLYYRDANGNSIQLTKNGNPNSGTGNISGLPSTPTGGAGIGWQNSQGTFQFTQDSGAAGGNADIGTLILRYAGSYPTPSGNYIALEAPTSLATGYALTFPSLLPVSSGSLLTLSSTGAMSYSTIDNSSLQLSGGVISIKANGVQGSMLNSNTVDNSTLQYTSSQLSIKNSGVTGTQVANNINLPGKAVQENAKNVIVSNANATNSLAMIRGWVNSAGTASSGEGYSSVRNTTGNYTITFASSFADVPSVIVTPAGGGAATLIPFINSWGASSFNVIISNPSSVATDNDFLFIVVGQRS